MLGNPKAETLIMFGKHKKYLGNLWVLSHSSSEEWKLSSMVRMPDVYGVGKDAT